MPDNQNPVAYTQNKNLFIEQMRGFAVLLVLIYHYTSRVSYEYLGADKPPFIDIYTGKIGVYIFFVISGYLIAKTIQSSANVGEFYAKRISRIWPLFLLANIVIFLWIQYFPVPFVPEGPKSFSVEGRTIWDLFGTSFFLKDLGFQWIDGVFWSILVELKFYLFVGLFALFFKANFIKAFTYFAIVLATIEFLSYVFIGHGEYTILNKILHGAFIAQYLPFFAIGMILYSKKIDVLFAVCCILICAQILVDISSYQSSMNILKMVEFLLYFTLFIVLDHFAFKGKVMKFFGEYSYSIYLFHQVIGLSCIMMLTPYMSINIAIICAAMFTVTLSVVAAELLEWRYRRPVTSLLIFIFAKLGLNNKFTKLNLN